MLCAECLGNLICFIPKKNTEKKYLFIGGKAEGGEEIRLREGEGSGFGDKK